MSFNKDTTRTGAEKKSIQHHLVVANQVAAANQHCKQSEHIGLGNHPWECGTTAALGAG